MLALHPAKLAEKVVISLFFSAAVRSIPVPQPVNQTKRCILANDIRSGLPPVVVSELCWTEIVVNDTLPSTPTP